MKKGLQNVLKETFDLFPEDEKELQVLAQIGKIKSIPSHTTFIFEGEKANQFYVIVKGNVKIFMEAGQSKVTIYTAQPGEIVGFSSLVEPRLYKGDVQALTDVEVVEFNAADLLSEMRLHPRLGYLVMYRVSQFLTQRLLHSMFETLSLSKV